MSETFFKVYNWMILEGLSGSDLLVYAFIYSMNEMGITVRGLNYISAHTGLCKNSVHSAISRLVEKGYITKEKGSSAAFSIAYVSQNLCFTKIGKQYPKNWETDSQKLGNGIPNIGKHLISNKKIDKRNNEKSNKKSLVANSHSLEEISAETLVSLSLPSDPELIESILGFIDHRKKMKKPLTERALILNIRKAHKLSDGKAERMTELFNLAVERGWQGIYPESNQKGGAKNDNNDDEPFFK